jgi:hypothetical protein
MAPITQAPAMVIISGNKITLGHLVLSDTGGMAGLTGDIIPIIITTKTIIITTVLNPARARCRATAIRAAGGQAIMGVTTTTLQTGAAGKDKITNGNSLPRVTMTTDSTLLQEGIITQGRNPAMMAVATTTKDTNNILLADKPSLS